MTKSDLAEALRQRLGFTKARSVELTESILDLVKETLARGETVKISGFGSFEVRDKKPRKGRNPQTGEEIVIDARRVITFGPSAVLKERMNGRRGKAVGGENAAEPEAGASGIGPIVGSGSGR